ncbi:Hypothetical predicted protein [Mytilus galloprovincialis]|uniref:Mab-21-like HhH/H2TH-like domain-containing protein n=1 Tax=Mytilus galloprovincialis TaxID=29158 RepID=A0A8B6H3W6_MYTGA|nr:Hypothetical predicted protein [Mytilus galloprovincialis]
MSSEKQKSLFFYNYLCQKIGSEEIVRIRRLSPTIIDIGQTGFGVPKVIHSGSKGEGLDLKGSDLDLMCINADFKVYESETEIVHGGLTIPLIMNTVETQPCFTQLCFLNNDHPFSQILSQKTHLGYMLSNEDYKQLCMHFFNLILANNYMKIHGPCLSDISDQIDLAYCLQCNKWICQAQPWVRRPRTAWPSPEIISKMTSCGVLFVPIGCKGSVNENLEWRISFSVAEKFLIFSFSHTQFLCYALMKILLKEIIEQNADLKGLLCSYFLKTLMFWISEELEPNVWRPDNIIPCFMACIQRLLYCVRYSNLPHYFIPENNLFYSRFNAMSKAKLSTILQNVYDQGINCFASSETLQDYQTQIYHITNPLIRANFRTNQQKNYDLINIKKVHLLYNFLHHSRTGLSRGLFAFYISKACWFSPVVSTYSHSSENKQQYSKYKYDLGHLLIGLHSDALSGWMALASFFYVHKNYFASLNVIHYAMQKYTDEKIFTGSTTSEFTFIQKHVLHLMKNENLYTVLKAVTIDPLIFHWKSSIIPQELQLVVKYNHIMYHPATFAYFLIFLCYYHLSDTRSCKHYLIQLLYSTANTSIQANCSNFSSVIMCGIAYQLMGETNIARMLFQLVDTHNIYKTTKCAASSFLNLFQL